MKQDYYSFEQQLLEDFGLEKMDELVVSMNPEEQNSYLVLTPKNDFLVYLYDEPSELWMSTTLLEYQEAKRIQHVNILL